MKTNEKLTQILQQKLQAISVEVEDETWRHAGHAGAASGGGHFNVTIVSPLFEGKSLVERHQMVYAAVADEMQGIHALSIKALLPQAKP